MRLEFLDMDQLIANNDIQEVTSGRLFSSKMTFDPDGVLSKEIFGESRRDRRGTFGYINLGRPFISPHIYIVMKRFFTPLPLLISGLKRFSIVDGSLVEDPENGWTGLTNLYKHWNSIDWSKKVSSNVRVKKILVNAKREQIFMTKYPVCPPAYRDVTLAGMVDASDRVDASNKLYTSLIRQVKGLATGGQYADRLYKSQLQVQETLVEIYNYFKNQISKKSGLVRKYLMGKTVDFGTRAVISAFSYNNETIQENMVDIEHTALPIAQCCSTFYPLIEAWLKNFFTREIINDPNLIAFYDIEQGKEVISSLKDPEMQFSDKNIKKMINDFIFNPDNRFKVVTVDTVIQKSKKDKTFLKVALILKGKRILPNNMTTNIQRPMTITDILYLACVDVCERRHAMISRYPVGTDKGIFFNKIRVQSTREYEPLLFNGKEYPFYPKINLKLRQDLVGIQFIDTCVYSNSLLEGMGESKDRRPCKIS